MSLYEWILIGAHLMAVWVLKRKVEWIVPFCWLQPCAFPLGVPGIPLLVALAD